MHSFMYSLFLDEILISKAHKGKPHKQIKSGRRRFFSLKFLFLADFLQRSLTHSILKPNQSFLLVFVYHNKVKSKKQ